MPAGVAFASDFGAGTMVEPVTLFLFASRAWGNGRLRISPRNSQRYDASTKGPVPPPEAAEGMNVEVNKPPKMSATKKPRYARVSALLISVVAALKRLKAILPIATMSQSKQSKPCTPISANTWRYWL
jgi:hypothetical protein